MLRFPRVVRLDGSDAQVFDRAAAPGEWALTGSFAFAERPVEELDSKARLAFRGGWLGSESFGWASLVEVDEITEAAFFQVVERLVLDTNCPGVRLDQADEQTQQGRLAAPAGTNQRVRAARGKLQGDWAQDSLAVVRLFNLIENDHQRRVFRNEDS